MVKFFTFVILMVFWNMFIASKKKKENIAEYVIYMWQIEDLIRTYSFDIERIDSEIIKHFGLSNEDEKLLRDWYESLIDMMRMENVQKKGHLQLNKNVVSELWDLHKQILYSQKYSDYASSFYKILPYIVELKSKQQDVEENEIEVCFTFLYGVLLLRLGKRVVTKETENVQQGISRFLSNLSQKYIQYKNGDLELY